MLLLQGSSKLEILLAPGLDAAAAARSILRILLATMLAAEDGTRADRDPEFLHDFRVALRRARSLLAQLRAVFPADAVASLRAEMAWLGQASGPTRDLDVYLLTLREERATLPEAVQRDLEPLVAHLHRQQRREQARLRAALDSERYRALISSWRGFLEPAAERPAATTSPIEEVASARIWRAFRRVRRRGEALAGDASGEVLHALRIECKKLRYLLELFQSLYEPGELEGAIARLKRLQDHLGIYNDCEVQERHLVASAHELAAKGGAPVATLLAMGRLLAMLDQRREQERRDFAASFAQLTGKASRRRFRRMFKRG